MTEDSSVKTANGGGVAGDQTDLPEWGRVLIVGGTDWPTLGRKLPEKSEEYVDLPVPHILRDVAHERIKNVFTSGSASHAFFLNEHGDLFGIGRNEHGQVGFPLEGSEKDVGGTVIYRASRLDRSAHFLPPLPADAAGDVMHVACGRAHSILCTRDGSVYATGNNSVGQCGHRQTDGDLIRFRKIAPSPFAKESDPVIMVGAGLTFSMIMTAAGKVYGVGSCEKGQMGNGKTGEHITTGKKIKFAMHSEPLLVNALSTKKIVRIACGQQHCFAIDEDGYCYAWGFGAHGRLGIGSAEDQLLPTLVPQFARPNPLTRALDIIAGPTCTVVIDRQRMYWLTGKWKTSGDGGSGQGYLTFRYVPDLMGCKMQRASLGGVSLVAIADEEKALRGPHEATMNIAWGQNAANGELGLGHDAPRSATKPQRCEPLDGISIIDVACGQNTVYYVARNQGEAYSELPAYPGVTESQEDCLVCGKGDDVKDESNALLECERCEEPWHLQCLDPPLDAVPDGEWHCPRCCALVLDRSQRVAKSVAKGNGTKKRAAADDEATQPKKAKGGMKK